MIRNILIDLGNTIINNLGFDLKECLSYIYDNSSLKLEKKEFIALAYFIFRKMYSLRDINNCEVAFDEYLKDISSKLAIVYKKSIKELEEDIYRKYVYDSINNDAKGFLEYCLKNKLNVYLYSNSTFKSDLLKITLSNFQIDKYFKAIYSSADFGYRKPSLLFFEKTKLEIRKEDSIFIGNDYGYFAKECGWKFMWYNVKNEKDKYHLAELSFSLYKDLEEYIDEDNK